MPNATQAVIAASSSRVPAIAGQANAAAPIAPAAAPNTARIRTINSRYAASNSTQKRPSKAAKKTR